MISIMDFIVGFILGIATYQIGRWWLDRKQR